MIESNRALNTNRERERERERVNEPRRFFAFLTFSPKLSSTAFCGVFCFFVLALFLFFAVCPFAYATTPDEIAGLKLWLDASQGVTTDGSTPAADGDAVQQWNDQSSGGYNATQLTAEKKPTYKTNILNGQPVLRFDGAQNITTGSFLDASFNTAFTFFIVTTKNGTAIEVSTSNQGTTWASMMQQTYNININTSNLDPAPSSRWSGPLHSNQNPGVTTFRYDGASTTTGFNGASGSAVATGNVNLTGSLTVGSTSANTFYWHGDIAEVVIYNSALSDAQINQIEAYLMVKYGISTNPFFVFDGDSITSGYNLNAGEAYPSQVEDQLGLIGTYWNVGVGGQTEEEQISDASTQIDPEYKSFRTTNILVNFGGSNDLDLGADAATAYNRIVSYCQARQAAGFSVIIVTMLPRTHGALPASFEADRQTVNANIRNNWRDFADGIADVASDSRVGDDNDDLDTTYYQVDHIHPNSTGAGVIATYVTAAIKQIMDPITVSDISVTPTTTTANIAWTTNQTGSTKVNYGSSVSYGSSTAETDTATRLQAHAASLSGLTPNTTYHLQAVSNDLNGNQALSADQNFTTLAATPTNLSGSGRPNSISLTVDSFPNDSSGSSGYNFTCSGTNSNSGWIQTNSWQDTGLACNTSYAYSVKYRNGDGVETAPISLTVSTSACGGGGIIFSPPSSTGQPTTPSSNSQPSNSPVNNQPAPLSENTLIQYPNDYRVYLLKDGQKHWIKDQQTFTAQNFKWSEIVQVSGSQAYPDGETIQVQQTPKEDQTKEPFTKNLRLGQNDPEILRLQQFLNTDPATRLAASGYCSPGRETDFFGFLTQAAVIKFQEKYGAEVLAPLGLKRGTGFFGESTRRKLNQLLNP